MLRVDLGGSSEVKCLAHNLARQSIIRHINAADQEKLNKKGVGVAYTYRGAISLSYSTGLANKRTSVNRGESKLPQGQPVVLSAFLGTSKAHFHLPDPVENASLHVFYFISTTSVA